MLTHQLVKGLEFARSKQPMPRCIYFIKACNVSLKSVLVCIDDLISVAPARIDRVYSVIDCDHALYAKILAKPRSFITLTVKYLTLIVFVLHKHL